MASRPSGPGRRTGHVVKQVSTGLLVFAALAGVSARSQASDAGMSLHGDLMTPVEPDVSTVQGALGSGGSGHDPKVIYLRYADGTETHTANYDACSGKVPPFSCSFG